MERSRVAQKAGPRSSPEVEPGRRDATARLQPRPNVARGPEKAEDTQMLGFSFPAESWRAWVHGRPGLRPPRAG